MEEISQSIKNNTKKRRNIALDAIRCIAIIAVICEHTSSAFLEGNAQIFFSTLGTFGVPFFIMLTGYLMLDREYSENYLAIYISRNLFPLFIAFEIWNVIWFLLSHILGNAPISIEAFLKVAFFMGPTNNGMWFLPLIIGLYLGIPIVSKFLHWNENYEIKKYSRIIFFCIIFFGTVIPTIQQSLGITHSAVSIESVLRFNIFGANVWGDSVWMIFLIAGFAAKKQKFNKISTPLLYTIASASAALLLGFHLLAFNHGLNWDTYYANIFLVISAICYFVAFERTITVKRNNQNAIIKIISAISRYSFATYMIHFWVIELCSHFIHSKDITFFLISGVICFSASLITISLVSRIEPIKRWLFLIK